MSSHHDRPGPAGHSLRRRLGSVAALVLLATTASLARATPAAAACSSIPTTDGSSAVGPLGPAGFIGDSTGIGMIELGNVVGQLRAAGWGPVRATAICGGRTQGTTQFSALTTLAEWRRSGFDPQLYVVALGSNDVGFCENRVADCRAGIDGVLRTIGGDRHVVWQNISHPQPSWETAWNQALADARAVTPLMVVADWLSAVNANPALTTWDRVHAADGPAYTLRSKIAVDAAAPWARATSSATPAPAPVAVGDPAGFAPLDVPRRVVDTRTGTGGATRLAARGTLTVDLGAVVPAGSTAAAVNLTVDGAAGPGYLTAWGCDGPAPTVSSLNYPARAPRAAHAVVTLTAGRFCLTSLVATDVLVDVFGSYGPAAPLRLTPAEPRRLLDTRTVGTGAVVPARTVTEVSIPASGADVPDAVALNLTATDATGPGFVAAYPCGGEVPTVSALNVDSAAPRANLVQVDVGVSGRVCLFNLTPMHLVVDLAGTYGPSGLHYQPALPLRLVDTRVGTGGWLGAPASFQPVAVPAVPGAAAVTLTATVSAPSGAGFLTAYPCAGERPTASNLNYGDGETAANGVIAGAGSCLATRSRGQLVVDLTGWWVA